MECIIERKIDELKYIIILLTELINSDTLLVYISVFNVIIKRSPYTVI